jgi:hypothetical protein
VKTGEGITTKFKTAPVINSKLVAKVPCEGHDLELRFGRRGVKYDEINLLRHRIETSSCQ